MGNPTDSKRNEILVVVVTVLVIAFVLGGLTSVTYPVFMAAHAWLTVSLSLLLLVIAVLVLYVILVSSVRRSVMIVEFPVTFNRHKQQFVDLPHCPMSVHARFCFDELPPEGRAHLSCYDSNPMVFFGSDLARFIDQAVQEALLDIVVFRLERARPGLVRVSRPDLPIGILENRFNDTWIAGLGDDREVYAPYLKSIESFGRQNAFFRVVTKGGSIELTWQVSYSSAPWYSDAFCQQSGQPENAFHDFCVTVTLTRSCNAFRLFSRKVGLFMEWARAIEASLREHDWKGSQNDRLLLLIHRLSKAEPEDGEVSSGAALDAAPDEPSS